MISLFHRLFHSRAFLEAEKLAEQRNCELMLRLEQLNESTARLRKRLEDIDVVAVAKETSNGRGAV